MQPLVVVSGESPHRPGGRVVVDGDRNGQRVADLVEGPVEAVFATPMRQVEQDRPAGAAIGP